MNILDRFEQFLERLVEGSIGRIFRSPMQPAEIGRKLERAMIDNQVISVGSTLVPNNYQVTLHPDDLARFANFQVSLCRNMEKWLSDVAAKRQLTMVDFPQVRISSSETVSRRSIHITSSISEHLQTAETSFFNPAPTGKTEIYRPQSGASPFCLQIVSNGGRERTVTLQQGITTIGRAHANDLVFESGEVSRYHARLEYRFGQLKVIDLQSKNGTRVNGTPIKEKIVTPGDQITFGTTIVQVREIHD